MTTTFILLGKTYSYKNFINEFCKNNPTYNCVSVDGISQDHINIVLGNSVKDYYDAREIAVNDVYPVYIETSDYEILREGIKYANTGRITCNQMCQNFLDESADYSGGILNAIEAKIISASNACDACYEFIKFIKETVPPFN